VSDLTTAQYDRSQYVRCNTIGHAWFDYDNSDWIPTFGDPLVLRCERCGTERRDTIGGSGQIIARHYFYPDGYKYGRGERPTRSEFRRMLLEQKLREGRRTRKAAR
jgi:hypothetical protein